MVTHIMFLRAFSTTVRLTGEVVAKESTSVHSRAASTQEAKKWKLIGPDGKMYLSDVSGTVGGA